MFQTFLTRVLLLRFHDFIDFINVFLNCFDNSIDYILTRLLEFVL